MNATTRIALAAALLGLTPNLALAMDIHVAAGVSIAPAINSANPGDSVVVAAGIHPGGGWIERNGAPDMEIVIRAEGAPHSAIIQGGTEALRVGNSSYLRFEDLEVRGSTDNAVHIDGGSHHITLHNIYAHDAGFDGDVLKVNQCNHMTIEGCELARPGPRPAGVGNPYQECLDFVDVDDSDIRDNYLHDGGSMIMFVKGGSRRNVVERNVVAGQRGGASDPMVGLGGATDLSFLMGELYEVIGIVFRNNIVIGGVQGAVAVYDGNGVYIANNLLLDNDRVLIEFRAGSGPLATSTDVQAVDNLMVDTRGRMPTPYLLSSHGLTAFTTSHNLFWNNGAAIPTTPLLTLSAQPGHLVADPFVAAAGAFGSRDDVLAAERPGAGSPAQGSGVLTSGAPFFVTDDIFGGPRTAPFDRGPFDLGASIPPLVDAGTPDTGPPPRDAGVPARDAGATMRDAGLPVDSGSSITASDAGVTLADSGNPTPRDAGIAPVDAGQDASRFADSGAHDSGSRATDGSVGDANSSDPGTLPDGCACSVRDHRGAGGMLPGVFGLLAMGAMSYRRRRRTD